MIIFFGIFFTLYGALNYYIFIRGWQALSAFTSLRPVYLVLYIIFAISYILSKSVSDYLPAWLYDVLLWIGSFWFAFMAYFFLSALLIDILRLVNSFIPFFPSFIKNNYEVVKQVTLCVVIAIVTITVILGYLNTRNIKINTYEITLPKGSGNLNELNVVLAADFHLSPLNSNGLLKKQIEKINSLNPDIVLLPGDIVDDKADILKHRDIGLPFHNIKSKYGIYASAGNHEFITGIDESVKYMQNMGMNVLRDSSVLIANSFYVAGRDDRSISNFTGRNRKSLSEIMSEVDKSYPTILLDHTPSGLNEAEENGISLQLSGHTHHGQIFPGNLITKMVYEVSWGYLRKGKTQYYVTSGAGTWGPPVRIGSDSEIVNLKIKFRPIP